MRIILLALLCALSLAACGGKVIKDKSGNVIGTTGGDSTYSDYVIAQRTAAREAAADRRADIDALGQIAASCTTDACREHIAALHALAITGGSQARAPAIAPPPPKQASGLLGFTKDVLGLGVQAYLGNEGQRTTRKLYDVFGGIAGALSERATVQVGGDYITGTQHVGDAVDVGGDYLIGDGNATNGSQIGDSFGDDYTGHDRVDASTNIDGDGNRINSDDTDNSDRSGGDGGECPGGEAEGGVCAGGNGGG